MDRHRGTGARILAKKMREGKLPESYLLPKDIDDIRSMVSYRRSLAEEIVGIKNRIHAMLAGYGITIEASDIFRKRSLKPIQESAEKMKPADESTSSRWENSGKMAARSPVLFFSLLDKSRKELRYGSCRYTSFLHFHISLLP